MIPWDLCWMLLILGGERYCPHHLRIYEIVPFHVVSSANSINLVLMIAPASFLCYRLPIKKYSHAHVFSRGVIIRNRSR